MKDKSLIAKVEETIEILEESETSLKQLKKDASEYKEIRIADDYTQRAKRVLDLLYERLIKQD